MYRPQPLSPLNPNDSRCEPPDKLAQSKVLVHGSQPTEAQLMDIESSEEQNRTAAKASFEDIVSGSGRFFPTISSLMEQLQEDMEEAVEEPDTPLKVSFTEVPGVRHSWVRYDTVTQRIPQLWQTAR